jgi:hypothetical protein
MHRIRLNWAARGGRGFLQQPRNPGTKFISKECRMEQATVLTWTPRKPAFPALSGLFRTIPIGHHQDIACSALPVLTTGAAVISVNAEVPPEGPGSLSCVCLRLLDMVENTVSGLQTSVPDPRRSPWTVQLLVRCCSVGLILR